MKTTRSPVNPCPLRLQVAMLIFVCFISTLQSRSQSTDGVHETAEQINYRDSIAELYHQDTGSLELNFLLAAYYYNRALEEIDRMDYDKPYEELFAVQNKVMNTLGEALWHARRLTFTGYRTVDVYVIMHCTTFGLSDITYQKEYEEKLRQLDALDRIKKPILP